MWRAQAVQNGSSGDERLGDRGLSEAAGRAAKQHPSALHEAVKALLHRWLYDNVPGHLLPPFRELQGLIPQGFRPSQTYLYYFNFIIHDISKM